MTTVQDKVFGSLEFDYIWCKKAAMDFFGKEAEISLYISGDESGSFEDEQYASYTNLMKAWNGLQPKLVQSILEYYKQKRHELGYDVEFNENYPTIETSEQLLEHITLSSIKIPYSEAPDSRAAGISFDCTWNSENGVGLSLVNEKIVDVGYQDVAI
ncbi:MAG: DUF2004 domain-containing protein [Cystobacterineae bacterium]|nr:DUF2004 domain-containing protein [Cystobacterineae bacterium]